MFKQVSLQKMTANICMSNENAKFSPNVAKDCNFFIHSLEAGAKLISYTVCTLDDRKLCKSIFKTELHFRFTIYGYIA